MACNNSRWKAANQSKDLRIRRRRSVIFVIRGLEIASVLWMVDFSSPYPTVFVEKGSLR
jgi:hypothetical protein